MKGLRIANNKLYSDTVNNLSEKIDRLNSVGQETFLYNSLRHNGRPDRIDISNPQHLGDIEPTLAYLIRYLKH
ncbi:DUF1704 domain-containing protein [Vibrio vulnificus]|nr:DUF1704 domain-containing protein [Vibrio vulnificus]